MTILTTSTDNFCYKNATNIITVKKEAFGLAPSTSPPGAVHLKAEGMGEGKERDASIRFFILRG